MPVNKDFNRFFAPEEDLQDYVHPVNIGKLSVPGGELITADPLVGLDRTTLPFTREVPVGEYDVVLCILSDDPKKSYGEYAAARVCFTDRPAVRFEEALVGTEDPEDLKAGKSFGFPVDTGMACFCDSRVRTALCEFEERMQQEKPDSDLYNDLWCDLLEDNAKRFPDYQSENGDWLNFQIPGTGYHLPVFRSGYGDGCYSTYWGLDVEGNICQAIIEFIDLEAEYQSILRKQARKNFQPDGLREDGKERIARRIETLRNIVKQHPEGHLPLANRIELYRHIGNRVVVQKILCECCKKVYPLWEQYVCKDQSFLRLLKTANDFLYHNKGDIEENSKIREQLFSQANRLRNYAEYYGENDRSITASAVVWLCYSIYCHAENSLNWEDEGYNGEDDADFDYEEWTTDYLTELAHVGQPESDPRTTASQRGEYWLWFLDMAETLYTNPRQEYTALAELHPEPGKTLFTREQSYMDGKYPVRPLSEIIRTIQDYLQGNEWNKAEISASIFTGVLLRLHVQKGEEKRTIEIPNKLYNLVTDLRKLMYNRCPAEGAWMEASLTLIPQGNFTLVLNYDDRETLNYPWSPDDFVAVFKEFPRSRLFTPTWWQNLLSYNTEYLLSAEEKAAMIQIDLTDNTLYINTIPFEFPLSPGALVRILGEERLTKGFNTGKDYDDETVEYNLKSFLLWNDAGIMAVRDDEDSYKITTIYLQLLAGTETDTTVPLPEKVFSGKFHVNGSPFLYEEGKTITLGHFEITTFESSKGYIEIVYSRARDRRDSYHNYRIAMEENRWLTLNDKEHIRVLEKAEERGKEYHPEISNKKLLLKVSKEYLAHALTALTAGYALGKSDKFLRSMLLEPVAEAALKRYEYRKISEPDLLLIVSAFVLLNLDKRDFEKFAGQLKENNIHDSMLDTLIRHKLPDWEVTEDTRFPELKEWFTRDLQHGEIAISELEESLNGHNQPIIRDAILKIREAREL